MSLRFFLYSYDNLTNFLRCKEKNLLDFPKGEDYSWTKVLGLKPGDIILLRNSSNKSKLEFFGHCVVVENAYEEQRHHYVWDNEILEDKVIYQIRVRVDFDLLEINNLHQIDWGDLEELKWRNKKKKLMDRRGLAVKFSKANFVEGIEAHNLSQLLEISIN